MCPDIDSMFRIEYSQSVLVKGAYGRIEEDKDKDTDMDKGMGELKRIRIRTRTRTRKWAS
jgi:hypothetical protein